MNDIEIVAVSEYKDSRRRLYLLGTFQCFLGFLCILAILITLVPLSDPGVNAGSRAVKQMITRILACSLLVVWFSVMGVGSMRYKRWARDLTVVGSWFSLAMGISLLVIINPFMWEILKLMGFGVNGKPEHYYFMKKAMFAYVLFFHVLVPLAFVLLYGEKNVRITCEQFDDQPRWTDKCPLPVLALSIVFVVWGLSMTVGLLGWSLPFFGTVLHSFTGAAVSIALAGLLVLLAWRMYKLDRLAWWAAAALVAVMLASFIVTLKGNGMWEFYDRLYIPLPSIDAMKLYRLNQYLVLTFLACWAAGAIGYIIFIKHYFKNGSSQKI